MATQPAVMQAQGNPYGAQDTSAPFGPNNEQFPDELQRALWSLIIDLERQDDLARRREIQGIVQRRLFFNSDQYWWWSGTSNQWYPPTVRPPTDDEQELPAFQHVTNIYQAFTVSLMSVLSQNTVPARFWPQSARDPKDISTAKQATKVIDVIHRNNDMQCKGDDASFFMATDGFIGAYVRYVTDGERFGTDEKEMMVSQDVPIDPGMVECPECGYSAEGSVEEIPVCPDCGAPVQQLPEQMTSVPMPQGTIEIPRGQEVISIVPALHLKRSMYADEQTDFMYLTWVIDLHRAKAQATYPHVREKIAGSAGFDAGLASDTMERWARRMLYSGGGYSSSYGSGYTSGSGQRDLGTLRRTWIRPCAFETLGDNCLAEKQDPTGQPIQCDCKRCQLVQLFPHGCFVTFYNDIYCESKDECMDDKWETAHFMPGAGQVRETITSSLVPVQEQLNDASNMVFEQGMYGTPEKIIDQNLFDQESRERRVAVPGQETFVNLPPNQDIRSKIMYSSAVEPSVVLDKYRQELMGPIAQFLSGVFPALFGGDTGGNDTAQGIAMQRNQALGRIGRAWRKLQIFWANLDAKAVQCFAENRTEDVEIAVLGDGGEFESDWIRLADLQGNLTAYPEVDQQYPVLQAELRGLITNLFGVNEVATAVLMTPDNMEYTFRHIGLSDVKVPGEDQRKKTYKDIDRMLQEPPQIGEDESVIPSVVPDPEVDNLQVAMETAKSWLISEAGQAAKDKNPLSYANVRAYAMACSQLAKMQAFQNAIAAGAMEGKGPAANLGGQNEQPTDSQGSGSSGSPAPGGDINAAT